MKLFIAILFFVTSSLSAYGCGDKKGTSTSDVYDPGTTTSSSSSGQG